MILRALTLAGGIMGAGIAAQGPGFARAYVSELTTSAATLDRVIADFQGAAQAAGLSPAEALERLRGSALLERRRVDLARSIERQAALRAELPALQAAGPFLRMYHLLRQPDVPARRSAWERFRPGPPLTRAEWLFAALGGLFGAALTRLLLWLPTWPARARRRRALRA